MIKVLSLLLLTTLFSFAAPKKTQTVRFALWGGSENINNWIDGFVKKEVMKQFNIALERVPLSDTEIAIKKLLRDKKKKRKTGSIDLVWVNGENFKIMKDKNLTWKSYLSDLDNYKYLDQEDKSLFLDFGVKHEGAESPWGSAQMVMIYNSDKVDNPPKNLEQLKQWVKKNQGRFTYSSPPDFTGSAFIRLLFMHLNNDEVYNKLLSIFNREMYEENSKKLWAYLNEIKPYLYRRGKNYPQSLSKLHQLYSDEVLWMTFDYYPTSAQRLIDQGTFPKSTKTYVFNEGTLANTHFVSIPFNAPSKESARKVADFLMSPKAQLSKMDPKNWGDLTVLSTKKLSKKDRESFEALDLGGATLSLNILSRAKRAELPAAYVPLFEKDWKSKVLR